MLTQRNTKKQGDVGLGHAIAFFTARGYTVSLPLTDSQDYDLIVDGPKGLERVQVKTSRFSRAGVYEVELRTKGGNRSGIEHVKKLAKQAVDLLYVLTNDGAVYLIPTQELTAASRLRLGPACVQYMERTPTGTAT